jgi:hypothetical protein
LLFISPSPSWIPFAYLVSVTDWALKETGGATLWLMAGDTEAAVIAFSIRGTGGVSLGFPPEFLEVC